MGKTRLLLNHATSMHCVCMPSWRFMKYHLWKNDAKTSQYQYHTAYHIFKKNVEQKACIRLFLPEVYFIWRATWDLGISVKCKILNIITNAGALTYRTYLQISIIPYLELQHTNEQYRVIGLHFKAWKKTKPAFPGVLFDKEFACYSNGNVNPLSFQNN